MSTPVIFLVLLPLLGAFLLPTVSRISAGLGRLFGPVLLVLLLGLAIQAWDLLGVTGPAVLALGGFAPPLGITLYADRLALLLVLASAGAALLLWPRGEKDAPHEGALTLLLVAGANGLALSGDLFNLYVFYEILAVASYGLAASRDSGASIAAALRYLIVGAVGSAMALLGIGLVYAVTGTLNLAHLATESAALAGPAGLAAFALMAIGFGVKAELFPVNTWVPEVYATATARVNGLLAGLASKLALVVVLKVLVLAYADTGAGLLLLVLGIASVVTGELAAYRASDLRRVLAFSSIGQLGVMAIAFSLGNEAGVMAGLTLLLHHLLVKSGLFLYADAWASPEGAARANPWFAALFVLFALSLIGVPPLPGFWAKYLVVTAALEAGGAYQLAVAAVLIATVVETAYLFRIIQRIYSGAPREVPMMSGLSGNGVQVNVAAALLVAGALTAAPLGALLQTIAAETANAAAYVETVLPATWGNLQP